MLPKKLDSAQLRALKMMEEKDLLVLHGKKDSGKSFVLRHILLEQVFSGGNVLYQTEDISKGKAAAGFLKAFHLEEQVLIIEPDQIIEPEEKIQLLQILKEKIKAEPDSELALSKAGFELKRKKILEFYESVNTKILFDKSWHELVVLQAFDKHSSSVLHYNHLLQPVGYSFMQEEYDSFQAIQPV